LRFDRLALSGALAALLTVVLYLPALIRTGLARVTANPYVAPRPLGDVVRELPRTLGLAWLQWHADWPRLATVLFVLAWAGSLLRIAIGRRGCAAPTKLLLTVLGFSVAAALVQRVVPYDRVWLFALPLYLACVAEGLAGAIPDRPVWGPVQQALPVLLCVGFALCVVRGESLAPGSWGTLHHGDAIAALLGPILRDDDGVVALTPCDAPLKYEFLRQGIPVESLYDYRVGRARRLFVAVDRAHHQDLSGVLAGAGVPAQRFTAARLLRDFGDAAVFELRRRPLAESGASSLSKVRPSFTMEASPASSAGGGWKRSKKRNDSSEPSATDIRSGVSVRPSTGVLARRKSLALTTVGDHRARAGRAGVGPRCHPRDVDDHGPRCGPLSPMLLFFPSRFSLHASGIIARRGTSICDPGEGCARRGGVSRRVIERR
jgi:hypothetical protein